MTEKGKDRIWGLIGSLVVSTIVVYMGFYFNSSRADNLNIDARIDKKLDVIRYEKDWEQSNARFHRIETYQQRDRETYIQQVSEINTHILYIREYIEDIKKSKR